MTTTNELLDLLEQIPAWRRVRELPERIDALERLLVELDARTKGRRAEHCPICNEGLQIDTNGMVTSVTDSARVPSRDACLDLLPFRTISRPVVPWPNETVCLAR